MVVETDEEVSVLRDMVSSGHAVWVRAVQADERVHPSAAALSLVYVSTMDGAWDAVIPVDHHETRPAPDQALAVIAQVRAVTPDRARLIQLLSDPPGRCVDASLLTWWRTGSSPPERRDVEGMGVDGVSRPVWHAPVYGLADALRAERDAILGATPALGAASDEGFRVYNDRFALALAFIESEGIAVDRGRFARCFGEKGRRQIHGGLVHPRYTLYTSTGRPSNSFRKVNYAALKKGETRDSIVTRYDGGQLAELDYDGFHLRLIAGLVGYDIGSESVHTHLGRRYLDTEQLTDTQYDEAKRMSFRALYGRIPDEAKEYEYFRRVQGFIDELWDMYSSRGAVSTVMCGRVLSRIEDPSPSKLFNYVVQSYETEIALQALHRVRTVLERQQRRLRVCLYTYDSVLLDVPPGCEADVERVRQIMSYNGRFPVDVQSGASYGSLTPGLR